MVVTEYFQPGRIARFFGSTPHSRSTTWHSNRYGIVWRNDEGVNELDAHALLNSPYNCQSLYEQWKFRQKKYGPALA